MTISKYIAEFIQLYENIKIDTNHVVEGSDKYGLFKSPMRDVIRQIDGTNEITEQYQFMVSQKSISEAERKEDDEWLEDFEYWIDDYPRLYEYPAIDKNRRVIDIQCGGCATPLVDNDNGIMYQITLSITYEREVYEGTD